MRSQSSSLSAWLRSTAASRDNADDRRMMYFARAVSEICEVPILVNQNDLGQVVIHPVH